MAVFEDAPETYERVDWELLQNGPVTLYWRPTHLDEHVRRLVAIGYQVDQFDCSQWGTEEVMHYSVARGLQFPEYYGRNLDAFNDCLSEIEIPEDSGRAIVFRGYDRFAHYCPELAQAILDIIADQSRRALLFGRRLIALVQSDDATIQFAPVGGVVPQWNQKEWLNNHRGL